ncbi:Site-specific recombinase XerD [Marivirga sericea]|uniref:Site-specific recombinase XerD n=1 Tax=Marivirga sericea TaxID=1028 RepID=A0A1X7L6H5_9BACT|nr:site-specific integrase [Marivirga sericea]SMG49451.1 Site-specific recombinase XerD [Marivirga sericea]
MINITFFHNKQKIDTNNEAPIWMTLTFNGQRIRKSIKDSKIKQSSWNNTKARVKNVTVNSKGITSELINARLEELEENIRKINKVVLRENIRLNEEYILSKLENPQTIDARNISFFQAFDEFLEICKGHKANNTVKNYTTIRNFIERFQTDTKYKIELELIDFGFYEKLRDYAFKKKNVADNYFVKVISVLKTFMNWAIDKRYCKATDFKKFRTHEREKEVIYLTKEELFKLYNHNFESRKLDHVKDTFCFACFTGLRFSDLRTLESSNILEGYIIKNIQKTKEVGSKIPLNRFAQEILDKYRDTIHYPLPTISEQKYNKYIKECCEKIEIDTPTTIVEYRGNQSFQKTVPKHKLITSHVARKTFVTNSLIFGMKELVVRSITGHKKESSFKKYVKIADNIKQTEMENTWDKQ